MTREKSIFAMEYYKLHYALTTEAVDAFDMAIEALEQELCTDAISRQAVLNEIYNTDGISNIYFRLADKIIALPSVTPAEKGGHWIPVSERYPEDGQRVLVDYCDEDAGIMLIRFNVNGYHGFKAWMPLPERFKGNAK